MAELINVTQQAPSLQAYHLETPADMVTALEYLSNGGYTGSINLTKDAGGAVVWQMWVQNVATNVSQSANLDDWIVIENNAVARVVPAAQFANRYTTSS